MWEHFDDLPYEVFCVDREGVRHLLKRHRLESEAVHSMNVQNRSGGYAAEYWDWRVAEPKCSLCHGIGLSSGSCPGCGKVAITSVKDTQQTLTNLGYTREVKCMLCNDCGTAQGCTGCKKVDPYLKAYSESLVNDETGDPNS